MTTNPQAQELPELSMSMFASRADYEAACLKQRIRNAGGIVHSDGNIFFTNAAQFIAASQAGRAPKTAKQIREFVGGNACSMKFVNAPADIDDFTGHINCEASENDTYLMSAHDLLSSFQEWFEDYTSPVEAQAVEQLANLKRYLLANYPGAKGDTVTAKVISVLERMDIDLGHAPADHIPDATKKVSRQVPTLRNLTPEEIDVFQKSMSDGLEVVQLDTQVHQLRDQWGPFRLGGQHAMKSDLTTRIEARYDTTPELMVDNDQCSVAYLRNARPHIQKNHVDGPLLHLRDGRLHWLTLRERFQLWFRQTDAAQLELKYWHATQRNGN